MAVVVWVLRFQVQSGGGVFGRLVTAGKAEQVRKATAHCQEGQNPERNGEQPKPSHAASIEGAGNVVNRSLSAP